ncbi:MAG TPA: hypothetical protein DC049_12905, partial [Spirochaetia bacterium]|nr:hypothetical protein [Spirochaetia bacterium]
DLLQAALKNKNIRIKTAPALKKHLCTAGYDPAFGARPLKRIIQKELHNYLAGAILSGEVQEHDTVILDFQNGMIVRK